MRPVFLLALAVALSGQDTDKVSIPAGFLKATDYLQQDSAYRAGYAAGFFNGMSVAPIVLRAGGPTVEPSTKWLEACTKGMTDRQIGEIIRKHIENTPEQWHLGLNMTSVDAMLTACKSYIQAPR